MEYGLLGKKLGHSYSKEIHESIADYKYELRELAEDELGLFLREKDFKAVNVTIPYKEAVIPYLERHRPLRSLLGQKRSSKYPDRPKTARLFHMKMHMKNTAMQISSSTLHPAACTRTSMRCLLMSAALMI